MQLSTPPQTDTPAADVHSVNRCLVPACRRDGGISEQSSWRTVSSALRIDNPRRSAARLFDCKFMAVKEGSLATLSLMLRSPPEVPPWVVQFWQVTGQSDQSGTPAPLPARLAVSSAEVTAPPVRAPSGIWLLQSTPAAMTQLLLRLGQPVKYPRATLRGYDMDDVDAIDAIDCWMTVSGTSAHGRRADAAISSVFGGQNSRREYTKHGDDAITPPAAPIAAGNCAHTSS